MRIARADLAHAADVEGAVVVIDVLRAFSTAAYALAAGARRIVLVNALPAVDAIKSRFEDVATLGAYPGGAPIPGFDFPNSPAMMREQQLPGRTLILHTAGGVRGLMGARRATALLAGSLLTARATVRFLRALAPERVTLMITGRWTDRDGDEDCACADLLEVLLAGGDPPSGPFAARVRRSDFGRRFASGEHPSLPVADLEASLAVDHFDFAMPVRRRPWGLTIERDTADARSSTPHTPAARQGTGPR